MIVGNVLTKAELMKIVENLDNELFERNGTDFKYVL